MAARILGVIAVCSFACAAAADGAFFVDTFTVPQTTNEARAVDPTPTGSSIVGRNRFKVLRAFVSRPTNPPNIEIHDGVLTLIGGWDAAVDIFWPGNGVLVNYDGLGGLDFTSGGATDRIRIQGLPPRDAAATITLQICSSSLYRSYVTFEPPAGGYLDLPFSEFKRSGNAGPADFRKVGQVVLSWRPLPLNNECSMGWIAVAGPAPHVQFDRSNWDEDPISFERRLNVREDDAYATVTVERVGPLAETSTVQYATGGGTAVAGVDYTPVAGSLIFAAGERLQSFKVPVLPNGPDNGTRTVEIVLTDPTGASLGASAKELLQIHDALWPRLTIADVAQRERSPFTFRATLSRPVPVPYVFQVVTRNGTATSANRDFVALSQTVAVPAGATTVSFDVELIEDLVLEDDETFTVTFAKWLAAGPNFATGTILNDDGYSNLSLTMTASTPAFTPGAAVTYTLTVKNGGPDPATYVEVRDWLCDGMTLVSATASSGTCTGGPIVVCEVPFLAVGASSTVSVVATLDGAEPITNTASAWSTQADHADADNSAAVTLEPASVDPVPAVSPWMLAVLIAALGVAAIRLLR